MLKWLKECNLTEATSSLFVTNAEKMEAVYENPYILIYDKKISNMKEFLPILKKQLKVAVLACNF